jgi:hypothetical protein
VSRPRPGASYRAGHRQLTRDRRPGHATLAGQRGKRRPRRVIRPRGAADGTLRRAPIDEVREAVRVLRQAGSLSTEHVIPKWLRKSLQIRQPVREFRGTAYAAAAETLAVVLHEVCTGCNNGWMETLESATRPILGHCSWEPPQAAGVKATSAASRETRTQRARRLCQLLCGQFRFARHLSLGKTEPCCGGIMTY